MSHIREAVVQIIPYDDVRFLVNCRSGTVISRRIRPDNYHLPATSIAVLHWPDLHYLPDFPTTPVFYFWARYSLATHARLAILR